MNCPKYEQLIVPERIELKGKIQHLLQSDCNFFDAVNSMIRQAGNNGVFDRVTFMPEDLKDDDALPL